MLSFYGYTVRNMEMREKLWAIRRVTGWKQAQLAIELGVAQSAIARWTAAIKPSQPKGPNWDAINRLYDEKVGPADSPHEILLPNSLALKFFSLPQAKQNMIIGVIGAVIEIAERRD